MQRKVQRIVIVILLQHYVNTIEPGDICKDYQPENNGVYALMQAETRIGGISTLALGAY